MKTGDFQIWVDRFLVPLDDPGSRLFHLNLLIALVLVLAWVVFKNPGSTRTDFQQTLRRLVFRKKYWWNRSTKKDYFYYGLNSLFKVFLFIPFLDFSFAISKNVSQGLVDISGDFAGLQATPFVLLLFTFVSFVWDDFLRFSHHLLMHKVPWLWELHQVHHSARIMTPVTLFRNHPLESALATLRNSLSLGVSAGIFIFLFESQLNLVTLFGVNFLGFLFNLIGANLRHSHIPLSFGPQVETVLISPLQHQIHHSTALEHHDKNLGVSLALWDYLIGSLVKSSEIQKKLRFGLAPSVPKSNV